MCVDGSRIRKGKVADSEISGYVWTQPYVASVVFVLTLLWENWEII